MMITPPPTHTHTQEKEIKLYLYRETTLVHLSTMFGCIGLPPQLMKTRELLQQFPISGKIETSPAQQRYGISTCALWIGDMDCLNVNIRSLSKNFDSLNGVLHLLTQRAPKLACFVLYLKIINIFLKTNICIL